MCDEIKSKCVSRIEKAEKIDLDEEGELRELLYSGRVSILTQLLWKTACVNIYSPIFSNLDTYNIA